MGRVGLDVARPSKDGFRRCTVGPGISIQFYSLLFSFCISSGRICRMGPRFPNPPPHFGSEMFGFGKKVATLNELKVQNAECRVAERTTRTRFFGWEMGGFWVGF